MKRLAIQGRRPLSGDVRRTGILRVRSLTLLASLHAAAIAAQTIPVTGVVTSPAGPVAGAVVEFRASNVPTPVTATTDAAGKFAADIPAETVTANVRTGTVSVHLVPPAGAVLFSDDVTLNTVPANASIRLEMAPPVTLDVRALAPAGGIAAGIQIDVYSLTADRAYHFNAGPAGTARFTVFPDLYSVHARSVAADLYFGRVNLDARSVSSLSVDVAMKKNAPILTRTPPRASLISVSSPAENGMATVSGQTGSVEPLASVAAINLDTHQDNMTVSAADGSFSLPLFAPPGSHVQIKQDPTGRYLPNMNLAAADSVGIEVSAGTILSVNSSVNGAASWSTTGFVNQVSELDLHWRALRAVGVNDMGQWTLTSTTSPATLTTGQAVTLSGKLTIYSKDIDASLNLGNVRVTGSITLARAFDSKGAQRAKDDQFVSSVTTPSGLPIERTGFARSFLQLQFQSLRFLADGRLETDWTASGTVPSGLEAGYYVPTAGITVQGIAQRQRYFDVLPASEGHPFGWPLPVVRIGAPSAPRIACVLVLDDLTNGLRGSVAVEDRGKFQVASHVAIASDVTVLPPTDPRTGETVRYRLEPFAPLISASFARMAFPPQIAFKFPSGSLSVRVLRPDGTIDDLGSAPFQQAMNRSPLSRGGNAPAAATARVTDYFQLTTLDPRFEYAFTQYGLHLVLMDMSIEDLNGNVYRGGGTYEIWAARPLDIETGVLPGTPFETGNVFSPTLLVQPGVPADVQVRLQVFPNSDPSKAVVRQVSGRANRFGVFVPSGGFPPFDQPGEYRADITARYTDPAGIVWVGTATWGSVVETRGSSLVTHGRRGFDSVNAIQQQWFRVRDARAGGDHAMFPFHRGDVMWMQQDDPAADAPKITVQDPQGNFASRVRNRSGGGIIPDSPSLEDRISAGEIPLFSTSSTGESVSLAPGAADQWGYFYAYAERPGVHVRELISEDKGDHVYWRFRDMYHFQLGNGANGDQPNDFKFQFGGAVWRDSTGFAYYGAYASLFVLLPFNDAVGGRIFPPFQGNGGGPSGGPLLTLKGKAIDLFIHPTAVRPGTILQLGETASFSGHSAPTLPSKISVTVTSPSGRTRTIGGQASKIGYFYDPAQDFTVDEAGVWKAKVKVLFDGATSAGQVQPPYPTGDVLGSRDGEFNFYVVPANAPQVELSAMPQFVRPADGPVTFKLTPPAGLTNLQMTYTTVMPGFILEEGTASALTYTYDATKLAKDFPNLDLYDSDGFAGVDTITMSFLVSGTDASGARKHFARQIVLQGEEVQALAQPPASACPVVGTLCHTRPAAPHPPPRRVPPR